MDKTILILALLGAVACCIFLIYLFEKAQAESEEEYARLYKAYETALANNKTEKLCRQIFLEHIKEQHDKEIKKLREALHASEAKRKELCTRIWEEEKLK